MRFVKLFLITMVLVGIVLTCGCVGGDECTPHHHRHFGHLKFEGLQVHANIFDATLTIIHKYLGGIL